MDLLANYIRFLLRYSRPLFILTAVVLVAATIVAWGIQFEFSLERLFESSSRELTNHRDFTNRFGAEDSMLFVAYKTPDAFEKAPLAAVRELTDDLTKMPGVRQVFSLNSAVDFAERLSKEAKLPGAYDADVLKKDLTGSPVARGALVSGDGRASGIFIELHPAPPDKRDELLRQVQDRLQKFSDDYGMEIHVAGIPLIEDQYSKLIRRDTFTLLPVSIAVLTLLLALYFRNLAGTGILVAAVFASMVSTVALMRLLGVPIGVLTSMVPTLIMVVGLSESVHVLSHYHEELGTHQESRDAVAWTIVYMAGACFLTSLTNALGFGTMVISDLNVMREFGWTAAGGIMLSYLAAVVLLPTMLDLLPAARLKVKFGEQVAKVISIRLINAIGYVNQKGRVWIYLILAVVLVWAGFGISKIQIHSHWLQDMNPHSELYRAHMFIERNLSSVFSADFWARQGNFRDLETLREIDALERRIREGPYKDRITYTFSLAGVVKEANAMFAREQQIRLAIFTDPGNPTRAARKVLQEFDLNKYRALPETQKKLDAVLKYLEERVKGHDLLKRIVTEGWEESRVLVRMNMDSQILSAFVADVLKDKPQRFDLVPTGKSWMARSILDTTISNTLMSTIQLAFVLFLIFAIIFRSVKVGLMAMAPNLIPPAVVSGFMGWMGIDLNYSTVAIFGITLGLTVENTIQYLLRYRMEVLKDQDYTAAMYRTLSGAGKPLIFSNALLMCGFACVLLSNFRLTNMFGVLGTISIFAATLADVFVTTSLPLIFKPNIARWEFAGEKFATMKARLAAWISKK